MIATEKEAFKKRCCVDSPEACSAHRCMAWRWFDPIKDDLAVKDISRPSSRRGFCGLAYPSINIDIDSEC